MRRAILAGLPDLEGDEDYAALPQGCRDLIRALLDPNPETRPTAAEALEFPWVADEVEEETEEEQVGSSGVRPDGLWEDEEEEPTAEAKPLVEKELGEPGLEAGAGAEPLASKESEEEEIALEATPLADEQEECTINDEEKDAVEEPLAEAAALGKEPGFQKNREYPAEALTSSNLPGEKVQGDSSFEADQEGPAETSTGSNLSEEKVPRDSSFGEDSGCPAESPTSSNRSVWKAQKDSGFQKDSGCRAGTDRGSNRSQKKVQKEEKRGGRRALACQIGEAQASDGSASAAARLLLEMRAIRSHRKVKKRKNCADAVEVEEDLSYRKCRGVATLSSSEVAALGWDKTVDLAFDGSARLDRAL
jgi:serine/threonine protein kinase